MQVPAEETIFHTLHSVYSCARFPSECLIISLVYIERLIAVAGVPILCTSWRPILLAALILAQKARATQPSPHSYPTPPSFYL